MLSSAIRHISHLPIRCHTRYLSILRIGVDEAGRGAVLGPMVMSSVLVDSKEDEYFKKIGVKDSKELLPEKRGSLYSLILERVSRSYSYHLSSLSIDKLRKQGLSMNRIEENHILDLLSRFSDDNVDEVIVDAFVSKKNRLDTEVRKLFPNSVVKCEFHADANYVCVAAASIIAKVERDRAMAQLSQELDVELGTGYPHDPLSIAYLRSYIKEHGKPPIIARSSWITTQRILKEELEM